MRRREDISPEISLVDHGKVEEEGVKRERRRRTKLDGSGAADSRASFVGQEDDDLSGLTHAESVELITTR